MNRETQRVFFLVPGWVSLVTFFVAVGCSRAPSHEPEVPEPQGSGGPPARPPSAPATEPTLPGPTAQLTRGPDIRWSTGVVLEGTLARQLGRAESARLAWRRQPGSEPAWLALDQHRARVFVGSQLALNQLLDEDQELAPGHHRLVAVRQAGAGYVLQHDDFWLETSEGARPSGGCVLLAPTGTFNGAVAAGAISLLVFPLDREVVKLRATWEGPGEMQDGGLVSFAVGAALDFRPQARVSGDFGLGLDCMNAAEQVLEKVSSTFTVNRDAPVRGASK